VAVRPVVFDDGVAAMDDQSLLLKSLWANNVVALRNVEIEPVDLLKFARELGSHGRMFPNLHEVYFDLYDEDYTGAYGSDRVEPITEEEIEHWHVEHAEMAQPILAGMWSMFKFTSAPGVGDTGFFDMGDGLTMLSEEDRAFIDKIVVLHDRPRAMKYETEPKRMVGVHPKTGREILRLCPCGVDDDASPNVLVSVDDREPTDSEIEFFRGVERRVLAMCREHETRWSWRQNDVLLIDIYSTAHSPHGGFRIGERHFDGIWMYDNEPS